MSFKESLQLPEVQAVAIMLAVLLPLLWALY